MSTPSNSIFDQEGSLRNREENFLKQEERLLSGAPLFAALYRLAEERRSSFHMPGGRKMPDYCRLDTTEGPGSDDLNAASGPALLAEEAAAAYFGSRYTRLLTGGSSQGIKAALLALATIGGKLIAARAVHRSVWQAAQLFRLDLIFVSPETTDRGGDAAVEADEAETEEALSPLLYPSLRAYRQALERHPDARLLIVTSPDYFGRREELAALWQLCRQAGVYLVVDAAHGAHLHLLDDGEICGDVVIESAHKTLPALTPAAYLHLYPQRTERATAQMKDAIDLALRLLNTSSPPLFVAASADWARAYLQACGAASFQTQLRFIAWLRTELPAGLTMLNAAPQRRDPLRIVIDTRGNFRAGELARYLADKKVDCEFHDLRRLVFIPSLQSGEEDYRRLAEALKKAVNRAGVLPPGEKARLRRLDRAYYRLLSTAPEREPGSPDRAESLDRRERELNRRLRGDGCDYDCDLRLAAGRRLAEDISPYPPGICLLRAGELLSLSVVQLLEDILSEGLTVNGLRFSPDQAAYFVRVLP